MTDAQIKQNLAGKTVHDGPRRIGKFVVFEGGEGAGKTTQIEKLKAHLLGLSIPVLVTREPGGTPNAEALRTLIVSPQAEPWHPLTEAFVMTAARNEHWVNVILPALTAGTWVLCDRFTASTIAYQGDAGGADVSIIMAMQRMVLQHHTPDATIVLDIDPAVGLQRAFARGDQSRFEAKTIEYHEAIRASYLAQSQSLPEAFGKFRSRRSGWAIIDGSQTPERVSDEVCSLLAGWVPQTIQDIPE